MVMIYLFFWSFLSLGVGLREGEGEEEVLRLLRRLWEGERRLKQQREWVKERKSERGKMKEKKEMNWYLEVREWRWEMGEGEYLLLREGERETLRPISQFSSFLNTLPNSLLSITPSIKNPTHHCSPIFPFPPCTTHQPSM